jgi:predicted esterase
MSIQLLKEKGYNVEHRIYEGMGHSCCNQEIIDMAIFLNRVLGFEE